MSYLSEDFILIDILYLLLSENYGRLLDHDDIAKAESLMGKDLFGLDVGELRRMCFGNVIDRMLEGKNTTLSGQTGTVETDLAPFLYFYNSLVLDICPGCPQALNPKVLEPYLERKLIVVRTRSDFEDYFPDFQELAFRYKEYFIGNQSMVLFKLYRLNDAPPHDPTSNSCLGCALRKKLDPYHDKIKKYSMEKRTMLGSYLREIDETPISNASDLADLFIRTMRNPTKNRMRELEATINLTSYLSSIDALKSTPQFNSDFISIPDLFVKSLRINHQQDSDLERYLDIVVGFKGTLSPEILPTDPDQILSRVQKINEEIDTIDSSKRGKVVSFLSNFLPDLPSILTNIATHGTYGAEGVYKKALHNYRSPSLSIIRSKILSKYHGISEIGAQIWQIRNELNKSK